MSPPPHPPPSLRGDPQKGLNRVKQYKVRVFENIDSKILI